MRRLILGVLLMSCGVPPALAQSITTESYPKFEVFGGYLDSGEFPYNALHVGQGRPGDSRPRRRRHQWYVVDPKNWTVFDQQHTVQKGESTDAKTSYFQTRIQGPRRPPGSDRGEDRCSGLS